MKGKNYIVERFFILPDETETELRSDDIFSIQNKLRDRYLKNMKLESDNNQF